MAEAAIRSSGRWARVPTAFVLAGVVLVCATVAAGRGVLPAAALLLVISVLAAGHRFLSRWDVVVGVVVMVVLLIPIKRYGFAASLPFDLEPYRILVALIVSLWIAGLLVDSRVMLRRSALDAPLAALAFVVVASVVTNPDSVLGADLRQRVDVSSNVTKELLFFMSFFLIFYLTVSVVRSPDAIHAVLKTLVVGAAIVAFFALIERRTRYNVFDHLEGWIPFLNFEGGIAESGIRRGGRLRVYASAQHPIALAAMLVMVVPLAAYLWYQTRRRLWLVLTGILAVGVFATVSRTGILMLFAVAIVALVLRPATTGRAVIALLPLLVAVHLITPGSLGSLRGAFFPREGLIAEQSRFSGRASPRRLEPQFAAIRERPAVGQGYGTRVTQGPLQNARVLDNQWLATAVEIGLLGVFVWVWLFVSFIRKAGRAARRDLSGRGALLTALASSVAAFAVGMFTYDAFSFIQVVFVLFFLLAIGSSTLAYRHEWPSTATGKT